MRTESASHNSQPLIHSVVIPAYNAAKTIGPCLEALLAQSIPREKYEVIVVDDGSTDETAAIARDYGVCTLSQSRQGPAVARNRGIKHAQGDIVLFTDSDCVPTPTWIEEMTIALADSDVVGARGTYLTQQRELVARFVQIEYEDRYDRMRGRDRIDFIDTYSAAYRRDVLLTNGGFDTAFSTVAVEDQELSFRLTRKGYKLIFVPRAKVYHIHAHSCRRYTARKFNIGYWKALLTRWHPERMVSDTHTPQVLKAQMMLIGLVGLSLLAIPFWREGFWIAGGFLTLFLASTFPFTLKAVRKDPVVALFSPFLLYLRATALGAGFCLGLTNFILGKQDRLLYRADKIRTVLSFRQRTLKRAIDVAGSLVGLLLVAPLLPSIALLIKLDSHGPVFYGQERVGEEGRIFRVHKFRSIVADAEKRLDIPPDPGRKSPRDSRVTCAGRILKRTSLDEAPQFWNVLRGDMSLVGPQPEEPGVVQSYYSDWHRQRLSVRPGMTGPIQIGGRADLSLDARVQLELAYIQDYSLWKDISILVRTLHALLTGRGAY